MLRTFPPIPLLCRIRTGIPARGINIANRPFIQPTEEMKMKKPIHLLLAMLAVNASLAQRFDWATSGGYTGIANSFFGAVDIAVDPQGNSYTMDYANGAQACQGVTKEPFGSYTTFIYKFDPQGTLLFINRVGAEAGSFRPFNVETDDEGNLYLLGQPDGINSIIVNEDTVSVAAHTNQLIKIDSEGNYVWRHNTGFAGNGQGCMLQYANGYLYFQSSNLGVSRIDPDGSVDLSLTADYYSSPTASSGLLFKGSDVFSDGDLLLAAYSPGTVAFGEDTLYHTGNPFLTAPILLLRCGGDLSLDWSRYLSNCRNPDDNFIPVTLDNADHIYVGAQVNSSMTVGDDTVENTGAIGGGVGTVAKLDGDGNGLWIRSVANTGLAYAWCLRERADGDGIIVGGGYNGIVSLDDVALTNTGGNHPFIAHLSPDGGIDQAFNFLAAPGGSGVKCLEPSGDGAYLVGGKLPNAVAAPVFSCTPIDPAKGFYLGRLTEQPDQVPAPTIAAEGNELTAHPPFGGTIQWFLDGSLLEDQTGQSLTAEQSGNYTVEYSYLSGCVGSATSEVLNVTVNSLGERADAQEWSVFPNPTAGAVRIAGSAWGSEPVSISVRDVTGATILLSQHIRQDQWISLQHMAAGLYFVEILHGASVKTFRVVKQ
jgi:hypothetical protein